jgi:hypothetical protein
MSYVDFHKRNSMIWQGNLSSSETLLLIAFTLYTDAEGKCFPGVNTLAKMTKLSRRTVQRLLDGLVVKKIVTVDSRYAENGSQSSNLYKIDYFNIPSSPPCHHDTPPVSPRHPPRVTTTPELIQLTNPVEIKDQDARASKFEPSPTQTLAAGDPFESTNSEEENTPQATEPLNLPPSQSVRIRISGEEKEPPACRTTIDNTSTPTAKAPWGDRPNSRDANRAKAKANSFYQVGLKNNRWSDRADFKKFENYAADWVKNHPELVLGGKKEPDNPQAYLIGLLNRTAQCIDEGSKDLVCWKNWQLEKQAYSPEFVAPEPVIFSTSAEESKARIQAAMEKFNAQRAANRAAQEAEDREYQENRWFSHAS